MNSKRQGITEGHGYKNRRGIFLCIHKYIYNIQEKDDMNE